MATSRSKEDHPRLREKVSSTLTSTDTHHGRRVPKPLSLPDRSTPSVSGKPSASFSRPTASSTLHNASTHGKIHHPPAIKQANKSPSPRTRTPPANERGLKASSVSPRTSSDKPSNAIKNGRTHALLRARSPNATTKRTEANATTKTKEANASVSRRGGAGAPEIIQTPAVISELEEIKDSLLDELPDPILTKSEISELTFVSAPQDLEQHETVSLGEVSETSTSFEAEGTDIDESKDEEKQEESPEEPKGEEKGNDEKVETDKEKTTVDHSNAELSEPAKEQAAPVVVVVKKQETMKGMKKEAPKNNDVIEETRSKLLEKKKSKVKALVGAFETVMSLQESEGQSGRTVEEGNSHNSQLTSSITI